MKKIDFKKIVILTVFFSFIVLLPSFAYDLFGHFIASTMTFVPGSNFDNQQRSNMISCSSLWNNAAGETIFSRSSSTHNDDRSYTYIDDEDETKYAYYGYEDNKNRAYYLDYGNEYLACCYNMPENAFALEEFDIIVNNTYTWDDIDDGYDFFSVFLHELGHAAGLDHSSNRSAVMYPTFSIGEQRRSPNYDDIAGMHEIYYWNW